MIDGTRVVHEARYPHPPERVWRALTDQAELAAWLMPNDFVARAGARSRFDARPTHPEPIACEVLEVDPPRRLRTQWIVRGQPTTVTFELRAEGSDTVLRVEHDGLPSDEQIDFDGGWLGKLTEGIPLVLAGTLDPADATTTTDGFVTHSTTAARTEE